MKNHLFHVLVLSVLLCFLSTAKANNIEDNLETVQTIRIELEAISIELSNLKDSFVYRNNNRFSEDYNSDILLRINKLEERLSLAVGFMENIENKFEKTTKNIIIRMTEINRSLEEMGEGVEASDSLIELYDTFSVSEKSEAQQAQTIPEDQREYLSIKTIFDSKNYVLAIEQFSSFIERFKTSKLILKAKFWRAESNLRLGNWELAAEEFLETFGSEPNGPLSIYALFGLVLSLSELGEYKQSCTALLEIEKRNQEKFKKFQDQLMSYGKDLECKLD